MKLRPNQVLGVGLAAGAVALLLGETGRDGAITNAVFYGGFHAACLVYGLTDGRLRAVFVATAWFIFAALLVEFTARALGTVPCFYY